MKRSVGRPKADVSRADVQRLAGEGCSAREIGPLLGVSQDTIERNFADILEKADAEWRRELIMLQRASARKGCTTMHIWLGKNNLQQTDQQDVSHSGEVKINVAYE